MAAMEDNPCMAYSEEDGKDVYGLMKATQDSLDQLETKNSEQPNHMSMTNGDKNAIQHSFSTIPISYLHEQGSINSVEASNCLSHRR